MTGLCQTFVSNQSSKAVNQSALLRREHLSYLSFILSVTNRFQNVRLLCGKFSKEVNYHYNVVEKILHSKTESFKLTNKRQICNLIG